MAASSQDAAATHLLTNMEGGADATQPAEGSGEAWPSHDTGIDAVGADRRRSLPRVAGIGLSVAVVLVGVAALLSRALRGGAVATQEAGVTGLFGVPSLHNPFAGAPAPTAVPAPVPALVPPVPAYAPAPAPAYAQTPVVPGVVDGIQWVSTVAPQPASESTSPTAGAISGCFATEDGSDLNDPATSMDEGAPCVITNVDPQKGPAEMKFYMYRAGGEADYDLENVNAASLEGVVWYLHNEVVSATPRKYGIDRIRRYQVSVKNTQEFWNVHKNQFGPFLAFDAAKCTSIDNNQESTCEQVFEEYGFIVGCQTVSTSEGLAYLSQRQTTSACSPGSEQCFYPLWYSLPGPCPMSGIPQDDIDANEARQDVSAYKSSACKKQMPGGRCESATGSPDCTYSVTPAGEVMLNDLIGITEYNEWWNTSYSDCLGQLGLDCVQNMEYDVETDEGVGTDFWNYRSDRAACDARLETIRAAFSGKYPDALETMEEPICDFDMIYQDEFTWPQNHMGGAKSNWWNAKNAPAEAFATSMQSTTGDAIVTTGQ